MGSYIIRRILIALGMLLAASLLGFGVMKLTPGSYFDRLKMDPRISQETVDREIAKRGLDKPVPQQYAMWLSRFVRADLGESFHFKRSVTDVVGDRLVNTLIMNIAAIAVTWLVAIPLGIYARAILTNS